MAGQERKLRALDFAVRLNRVLNDLGWPIRGRSPKLQKELLKLGVEVSVTACTRWLSGEYGPDKDKLPVLAEMTGKTTDYFMTGADFSYATSNEVNEQHAVYRVKMIPLYSWDQATKLFSGADDSEIISERQVATELAVGDGAFAVTYSGDIMTSTGVSRSYPQGASLIFDRACEMKPPCRVAALVSGELVFRELVSDAGKLFLKPVNPQYRTITVDNDVELCAVLREYRVAELV